MPPDPEARDPETNGQHQTLPLERSFQRFYGSNYLHNPDNSNEIATTLYRILGGATLTEIEDQQARSPEFIQRLNDESPQRAVETIYHAVLEREPDAGGQQTYVDQIENNRPIEDVLGDILESGEYSEKLITKAYREILGREPDAGGKKNYLDQLRGANPEGRRKPFSEIVQELKNSGEYKDKSDSAQDRIRLNGKKIEDAIIDYDPLVKKYGIKGAQRIRELEEQLKKRPEVDSGQIEQLKAQVAELSRQLETERGSKSEIEQRLTDREEAFMGLTTHYQELVESLRTTAKTYTGRLTQYEQQTANLKVEVARLQGALRREPINPRHPLDAALAVLGYSRASYALAPGDTRSKLNTQLRRMASYWHTDINNHPSAKRILQEFNSFIDDNDPTYQERKAEGERQREEELRRRRGF